MVDSLKREVEKKSETPSSWLQKNFYVPDPRDPVTGEMLPPGPIRLSDHQAKIIDAALEKDENGNFKYSTIVYSAPKKSGKSAITSGIVLYIAHHQPNSFAACIANDETQANNRLYGPIYTCVRYHKQFGGLFKDVSPNLGELTLPNFTKIRAIPCDAAGEAGAQPVISAFSELWAYDTERKRRMFTEMTVPPTLFGKAIRWIETYAGFAGKSELLEQLYDLGIRNGTPHPEFLDMVGRDGNVVKVNEKAGLFVYWDTEPRMLWQTDSYYQQEASILPPSEFERIHRNKWVSDAGAFVEDGWWDACENPSLSILADGDRTPVVVAIDMAVTRDCAAAVAVTRSPFNPTSGVAVRGVRIFSPKLLGGIIDQEQVVRPVIEEWSRKWNVVCWVYDPHQMAKLAQDLSRAGLGWFKPFGQQTPRSISDKELHDMILHQQVEWNQNTTEGDVGAKGRSGQTLYNHITKAGATTSGGSYRIEKLVNSLKVDAAVALSMAAHTAMGLAISNLENDTDSLIRLFQQGKITQEEFSRRVQTMNPQLKEVIQNG